MCLREWIGAGVRSLEIMRVCRKDSESLFFCIICSCVSMLGHATFRLPKRRSFGCVFFMQLQNCSIGCLCSFSYDTDCANLLRVLVAVCALAMIAQLKLISAELAWFVGTVEVLQFRCCLTRHLRL